MNSKNTVSVTSFKRKDKNMKRTRFIQRTVSSFLAVSMLAMLASCDAPGKSVKNDGGINQPRTIQNYYTSEVFEKPEDLGFVRNLFCAGDSIYVFGEKSSSQAEKISLVYNPATKETQDIALDNIEAEYVNDVYFIGDKILVMYSASKTYEGRMALLDSKTGEAVIDKPVGQNSYLTAVSPAENGDVNVMVEQYGMSQKVFLKTLDGATLEEKSSADVSETLGITSFTGVSGAVFDEDGSVFVSEVVYSDGDYENSAMKVVKLNPDGSEAFTMDNLSDLEGSGLVMRRPNGNMLVMSTMDYSNFYFNEFDSKTGEVTERYEVKLNGQQLNGLCRNSKEADIVYSDDTGLWKIDLEPGKKAVPEKIASFGAGEIPESAKETYSISWTENGYYFYGESYGDSRQVFYRLDRDGNKLDTFDLLQDDNSYIREISVNGNGDIVVLNDVTEFSEEDGEEPEEYMAMTVYDEGGTVKSTLRFDTLVSGVNSYIENVIPTKSGEFAALIYTYGEGDSSYSISIYDADGKETKKIEMDEVNYVENYISTESGDYAFCYANRGGRKIYKVDKEAGSATEVNDFDIPNEFEPINTDGNYDFCYSTSEGIYGFSVADNKSTEIVNWIDSDITFSVNNAAFLDNDTIICRGYDYSIGDTQIYFLKRADDETLKKIQNKKIITVAGVDVGYNDKFKEKIVEFNRNSDEFRMQLNDYGKYSKYEDDTYTSGAFQLNNDMTAGTVPDIIIGNGEVDMTSFAAKKIITDLNPFFEKDADIKREDLFENVLDTMTYDGKLFQIPSSFTVSALAAAKSKVGDSPAWTAAEFTDLKKNGRIFFDKTEREYLLRSFITDNLAGFVDFENKTCDFSNEGFTSLVDLIAEEGYVYDEENVQMYDPEEEMVYSKRFKEGKCQVEMADISGFTYILQLQQGPIDEEITLKGYPTSKGNGYIINPSISLAISEKSKNKDAAWEFIRSFLDEEYQDSLNDEYMYTIPLRKSSYEKLENKAKLKEEMNETVTKPDGTVADMLPLDDVTAAKIRTAVETADVCSVSDERIKNIINEALEPVFSGDKTSKEAADEIQSKVSIYLKEIK